MLKLEAEADGGKHDVASTFQVAQVTRPLMSVSKICDQKFTCHFDDQKAVVKDRQGKIVCTFLRRGGLYICKMNLKSPSPFTRPGR